MAARIIKEGAENLAGAIAKKVDAKIQEPGFEDEMLKKIGKKVESQGKDIKEDVESFIEEQNETPKGQPREWPEEDQPFQPLRELHDSPENQPDPKTVEAQLREQYDSPETQPERITLDDQKPELHPELGPPQELLLDSPETQPELTSPETPIPVASGTCEAPISTDPGMSNISNDANGGGDCDPCDPCDWCCGCLSSLCNCLCDLL